MPARRKGRGRKVNRKKVVAPPPPPAPEPAQEEQPNPDSSDSEVEVVDVRPAQRRYISGTKEVITISDDEAEGGLSDAETVAVEEPEQPDNSGYETDVMDCDSD